MAYLLIDQKYLLRVSVHPEPRHEHLHARAVLRSEHDLIHDLLYTYVESSKSNLMKKGHG